MSFASHLFNIEYFVMTRKEFWNQAYLAALHWLDADRAFDEATKALQKAEDKWSHQLMEQRWSFPHDRDIGSNLSES